MGNEDQKLQISTVERFGNMTRVYYKEAVGAIVVYDVTRYAQLQKRQVNSFRRAPNKNCSTKYFHNMPDEVSIPYNLRNDTFSAVDKWKADLDSKGSSKNNVSLSDNLINHFTNLL